MVDQPHNYRDLSFMKMGWIGMAICQFVGYFFTLTGLSALNVVYEIVSLGALVFMTVFALRLRTSIHRMGEENIAS